MWSVCVCVCVSHHGLCDEQKQHSLLHDVLRTEATARTQETGNSTNNKRSIPHTHTHVVCSEADCQIAESVQFLSQLWCCNTTRTTLGVSLHSTISNVTCTHARTHTHTHTHTQATSFRPSLLLLSLSFITFFASLVGSVSH